MTQPKNNNRKSRVCQGFGRTFLKNTHIFFIRRIRRLFPLFAHFNPPRLNFPLFPIFLFPTEPFRPFFVSGKHIYNMVYVPPFPRNGNKNNCPHDRRARRTSDRKRFRTILSEIYGGTYVLSAKALKNPPRGVCRGAEIFRFFGAIICSCLPVRQPQPQPLRRPWGCCPYR